MTKGILTNRELKNKVTGVDIYVSDYQDVPHRIGVGVGNECLYHVIVISNLFYYKTRGKHRESDVIQFMISKSFREFEILYKKLVKRFPSVKFPAKPQCDGFGNKNVELEFMDEMFKLVASSLKLSSSPMVISFLRGDKQTEEAEVETEEELEEDNTRVEDIINGKQHDNLQADEGIIIEEEVTVECVENVLSAPVLFEDDFVEDDTESDLFVTKAPIIEIKEKEINSHYTVPEHFSDSDSDGDELLSLSKLSEKQSSIKVQKSQTFNKPKNITSNNNNNVRKTDTILDLGKEDMFKRPKPSAKKSMWGDLNHHTLDDIFGEKKTNLFDDDDGDDIFRITTHTANRKDEKRESSPIFDIPTEEKGDTNGRIDTTCSLSNEDDSLEIFHSLSSATEAESPFSDNKNKHDSEETISEKVHGEEVVANIDFTSENLCPPPLDEVLLQSNDQSIPSGNNVEREEKSSMDDLIVPIISNQNLEHTNGKDSTEILKPGGGTSLFADFDEDMECLFPTFESNLEKIPEDCEDYEIEDCTVHESVECSGLVVVPDCQPVGEGENTCRPQENNKKNLFGEDEDNDLDLFQVSTTEKKDNVEEVLNHEIRLSSDVNDNELSQEVGGLLTTTSSPCIDVNRGGDLLQSNTNEVIPESSPKELIDIGVTNEDFSATLTDVEHVVSMLVEACLEESLSDFIESGEVPQNTVLTGIEKRAASPFQEINKSLLPNELIKKVDEEQQDLGNNIIEVELD